MARKTIVTARQPAAEGPDVIREDGSWSIYVDAVYCGSRSNQQDAEIEARRLHFENVEAAAVETADIAATCDTCDIPFEPVNTRVAIDLDTLTAVIDRARATRPSKRLEHAYEWLLPLASVQFDYAGRLIVDSATWSHSWYYVDADGTCTCPAHKPCWHSAARELADDVIESAAIDRLAKRESNYAGALADLLECF